LIRSAGWTPVAARDGLEALEIIQRSPDLPDAVLVDIEMPRMDGYELMSTLRAHPSYAGIPLLVLTSRTGEKHRQKALDLGATDYIVKPYQDALLLEAIRDSARSSRERATA
jgi:CheY-like chemotaxis protein